MECPEKFGNFAGNFSPTGPRSCGSEGNGPMGKRLSTFVWKHPASGPIFEGVKCSFMTRRDEIPSGWVENPEPLRKPVMDRELPEDSPLDHCHTRQLPMWMGGCEQRKENT